MSGFLSVFLPSPPPGAEGFGPPGGRGRFLRARRRRVAPGLGEGQDGLGETSWSRSKCPDALSFRFTVPLEREAGGASCPSCALSVAPIASSLVGVRDCSRLLLRALCHV